MANKIPTAEEFFIPHSYRSAGKIDTSKAIELAIEFAKIHREAQLKSILKNVKQEIACDRESTEHFNLSVKPSILNAYPLDKIK